MTWWDAEAMVSRTANARPRAPRRRLAAAAVAVGCLVGALAVGPAAAAPTPSESPSAEASADPSRSPDPTPTAEPTASPDVTAAPTPTVSPEASEAPTPTPTPSPTPSDTPEEDGPDEAGPGERVAPLAAAPITVPTAARLSGADRYATAVAASRATFLEGAETVVVAGGLAPADTVTGAAIAGAAGGPLLFVQPGAIPVVVADELRRLAPSRIIVVGGTTVVSDAVVAQLRGFAADVARHAGPDRYASSRAALAGWPSPVTTLYISDGRVLIDAFVAAGTAPRDGAAMMLIDGGRATPDAETVAQLKASGITQVIAVGGTVRIAESVLAALRQHGFTTSRLSGADRYTTSVALAGVAASGADRAFISNSESAPDSGVAAALAAVTSRVMLYARTECMPDTVQSHLVTTGTARSLVGGANVLEAPVASNTACSVHKAARQRDLLAAVNAALSKYSNTFSVTVRQVGGLGELVSRGGATRREPASMIKPFAAYVALKKVEQGKISMTTTLAGGVNLRDCIKIMLYISDNFCHLDIVKKFGWQEVNRMIKAAGFGSTTYGRVENTVLYAGNRSTTNDMTLFMQKLTAGQLLNKTNTGIILGHLKTQVWKERFPEGIPSGVAHYNKTGALWMASGLMKGDTIIVSGPKATYSISMTSFGGVDIAAFRAVSRAVYTHFNGSFGAAKNYPIQILATTAKTTLRATPGGAVRATINAGTYLEPYDAKRKWYQVVYKGAKYWIAWNVVRTR